MFIGYVKSKIKSALAFMVFMGVFCLIAYLYSMPWGALIYATILCVFFGLVFMCIDFFLYSRKVKTLRDIRHRSTVEVGNLPVPSDGADAEYNKIIQILWQRLTDAISSKDRDTTDMIDYYTLWAHQIKTPISAMRLLLQSQSFEGKIELQLELFKIEQYVEMVLQYLRLGSDTNDFCIREQNLDQIIRESVKKYSTVFIKSKISLEYNKTEYRPVTDEKWLAFVIEQILSNSLKYTAPGGKVTITEEDGKLVISDTGIGIKPEDIPLVFYKGYTGYNGRSDKKSTGIGLYICRQIMDKLGHSISLSSEVGKGTTVTINMNYKKVEFE